MTWCAKYGIDVPELLRRDVGYSVAKQQLIFTFKVDNKVVLWQARNFRQGNKAKYITSENTDGILPIYPGQPVPVRDHSGDDLPGGRSTCVLVEDCISAIKIARWCDSMPCLGSTLNPGKLNALRGLYDRLIVWLDGDKYDNAMTIATQARMLGMDARAFYSEADPKEYDDAFICQVIR